MKFKTCAIAAMLLVGLSGCASQSEVTRANIQIKTMEERLLAVDSRMTQLEAEKRTQRTFENAKVCYADNLVYSEGSIRNGLICERRAGIMTVREGKPVGYPLAWAEWKYKQ